MSRSSRASTLRFATTRLTSLMVTGFMLACSPDSPTATDRRDYPDHAVFAGAPGTPTVTRTSPDSAKQGQTLDVHVIGTGFTANAAATWQLRGVANPAKVKTNATTVLSATELVANITIADTADIAAWDVQVALVGGKKGIGSELFKVTTSVPPSGARWVFSDSGTTIDPSGTVTLHPAGIYGDGLGVNGSPLGSPAPVDPLVGTVSGDYQDVLCGLALRVYWWNRPDATGDGTLDPSLRTASTCPNRVYHVAIGSTDWPVWGFMFLWEIMQIPLNGSRRQAMNIRVEQPNCTRLRLGTPASESDYTTATGGVRVTRVAGTPPTTHVLSSVLPGYVPGEWVVETVDGTALCQYQKGSRWITASTVTGLYFRIHVTEIPPTL